MGFWQGKRVVVTGHTGFKGAWLTLWLREMEADVLGIALDPFEEGIYTKARIETGISDTRLDIRQGEPLKDAIAAFRPDVVFHLAAQSLVRESYRDPVTTYETNVLGTLNVLEAVRACSSIRASVMVTSDKCYENTETGEPFTEKDPMGGHDPYSSSKGCMELLVASYFKSFLSDPGKTAGLATARAGNVIGGGDVAEDRLIPDLIRQSSESGSVLIRNPKAVRPWQHVLEPLSGYLLLAERLWGAPAEFSEAWNFGPDDVDMVPVQRIVERFTELYPGDINWRHQKGDEPHEAELLRLDCLKAKQRLGWYPRWGIDQALEKIVEWWVACDAGKDMRTLATQQIQQYEDAR
ncbi:MAG: CDP-glucose 4,6-dehydratase [Pseudomonadota bacterium]